MNACHQLGAQRRVNRPVPGDPRLTGKGLGPDPDIEMAFAAFPETRMSAVALAVINHLQRRGSKCGHQT